jgi:hypothetical protein
MLADDDASQLLSQPGIDVAERVDRLDVIVGEPERGRSGKLSHDLCSKAVPLFETNCVDANRMDASLGLIASCIIVIRTRVQWQAFSECQAH